MQRLPTLVFDNVNSGDLDKIFLNANVQIKDDSALADGSGGPMYITVIDITNLGGSIATIADLLVATTQWVAIGKTPHGYIAETGQAVYEPDISKGDYFEYTLDQNSTINEPINGKTGDTGTIQVNQSVTTDGYIVTWGYFYRSPNAAPVMNTDKKWVHIFKYTFMTDGTIHMEFVSSFGRPVIFRMLVTSTSMPGVTSSMGTLAVVDNLDGTYEVTSSDKITDFAFGANKADVTEFDIQMGENLNSLNGMCSGMSALTSAVTSSSDTVMITDFNSIFKDCILLECISGLNTTNAVDALAKTDMFTNCPALVNPTAAEITDLSDTDGAAYVNTADCPPPKPPIIRYYTTTDDIEVAALIASGGATPVLNTIIGGSGGTGIYELTTDIPCEFLALADTNGGGNPPSGWYSYFLGVTKIEIVEGNSLRYFRSGTDDAYGSGNIDIYNTFAHIGNSSDLIQIDTSGLDFSKPMDMSEMFAGPYWDCISHIDTTNATSTTDMFRNALDESPTSAEQAALTAPGGSVFTTTC